jgi:hypothetical protein
MRRLLWALVATFLLANTGMSANSATLLANDKPSQAEAKAADIFIGKSLAQISKELKAEASYLAVDVVEMKDHIPAEGLVVDGKKIGENDVHVIIKIKPPSATNLWTPRFSFMLSFSKGLCAHVILVRKFAQ